jgi:hypothetical protein
MGIWLRDKLSQIILAYPRTFTPKFAQYHLKSGTCTRIIISQRTLSFKSERSLAILFEWSDKSAKSDQSDNSDRTSANNLPRKESGEQAADRYRLLVCDRRLRRYVISIKLVVHPMHFAPMPIQRITSGICSFRQKNPRASRAETAVQSP